MKNQDTKKYKTYIIDIDGTICTQTNGDYSKAKPIKERIEKINKLADEGNYIIYWTARGMSRNLEDVEKCYLEFFDFTYNQLIKWNCRFHQLKLGKPLYDVWVDDKAFGDKHFFEVNK